MMRLLCIMCCLLLCNASVNLQRKFHLAKLQKANVLVEVEGRVSEAKASGGASVAADDDLKDAHFATHLLEVQDHDGIQQRRFDDGGTAVILSNDNSVAQTWDDVVGRQVMKEAAQKHVDESRVKQHLERMHMEEIERNAAKQAQNTTRDPNEEAKKLALKRDVEQKEEMLQQIKDDAREKNEKAQRRLQAESELAKAQEDKQEITQKKELQAQEKRRKYISIHEEAFTCFPGRVIAEPSQIPLTDQGTPVSHYTLLFWVKPTGVVQNYWASLLHKGATNAQRAPAIFFYPGSTRLHIRSGIGSSYNSGSNAGADPSDMLNLGMWYHIALSHERDGQFRVYVNGEQRAYENLGQKPALNDGPLWAGDPWHPAAPAVLADVRYYSRVLAPEEISAIQGEHKHPEDLTPLPTGESLDQNTA